MKTATDVHQTHEQVMETGNYVCSSGEMRKFTKGDTFPVCPKTGMNTAWRHADHQHNTGDKVTEAGKYINADGEQVQLNLGDTFPTCPKTGNNTSWIHA